MDRLRETFPDAGVDGLLVTAAANIRWLTGFTGSAGLLLVTPQRAVLTSDGRYRTQSEEQLAQAGVAQAVDIVIGGVHVQREAMVAAWGATANLGLEADDVTWSGQRAWDEALGSEVALVPTRGCVEALRQVKDAGEVARMERAAAIADEALASVVPLLVGAEAESVTEAFVAAALDHAMRARGAEDSAFETIVASGPNSAKPHARPSDRRIRSGDPVVIDFGAIYEGYRSDMTRTFCVGGEPDGELARVFSVVAESQRVGVAAVAPGVVTGDVDRACRDVIADAGWAERFEHGTGHGVGLDIHEAPSVGPGATAILAPGVVATVEPGVYLAGVGGVRIEDTLVVVEDGSRPLTMFPKDVSL
ncbi:MAG TPA: aminopeptidase P family protein [Acidimicrobiales bacterium]|nr:aminopeptidase P family protein [Acidimicrobiales bacterium]